MAKDAKSRRTANLATPNGLGPNATRDVAGGLNIPLSEPIPFPRQCCEADLAAADRVIALKEAEHRTYLAQKFPDWPDRVEYWHVHDLDQAAPEVALAEIAEKVVALIQSLSEEGRIANIPPTRG